jgi:hypothetical protein
MGHFLSEQFPDGSLSTSILDSSKNVLDRVFGLLRLETMRMEFNGFSSTELPKRLLMKPADFVGH